MIRTQKQVKKDIQTFDDIIVSLKKQLKYVELSRHEMTKQLTIPVVSKSATVKSSGDFRDDDNRESQAEYYGRK